MGGTPVYNYFMKAEMDFADHERASEYKTADFHAQYPMAAVSYGEIEQEALDKANLSYTFKGIDGESLSAAANGHTARESCQATWMEAMELTTALPESR